MSEPDARGRLVERLHRAASIHLGPPLVVAVLAGPWLAGCARSARLDGRVTRVGTALTEAEAHGAMRCAPRELALAQSHLEFARIEREQGDAARAGAHLDIADENVRAARLLSAPGRCEGPDGVGVSRERLPAAPIAPARRRSHAR